MIDLRHPLAVLASRVPWQEIEASVAVGTPVTRCPRHRSGTCNITPLRLAGLDNLSFKLVRITSPSTSCRPFDLCDIHRSPRINNLAKLDARNSRFKVCWPKRTLIHMGTSAQTHRATSDLYPRSASSTQTMRWDVCGTR
jgi:hypothetical protein